MSKIYTIGHSTDSVDQFLEYLRFHQINTIVDVRSTPYSKFANQFNKDQLSNFLKVKKIYYIFMGDELGARHEQEELLFEDGTVDFSKVTATTNFKKGINRVENGIIKGYKIALMCSEKNPIECHRFSLISNFLHKNGYIVNHIVDENVFKHEELEHKLIDYYKEYHKISTDFAKISKFHCMQGFLFETNDINENNLYIKLNKLIGYNPIEKQKEAMI